MYLFFDTETTGVPSNYKAPVNDLKNWPRLVQIAWVLHDKDGRELAKECFIIKPNGFSIPVEVTKIHGITTEHAQRNGVDLLFVLNHLSSHIDSAQYLIAHNISYDQNIVGAEFLRSNMKNKITAKKLLCTMVSSVNHCAINGPYGYKWPKLTELHYKLFNTSFNGAHDAMADITATIKCFWEMRRRGLI
jgi:DNA polymerase-3 subunit epsilon